MSQEAARHKVEIAASEAYRDIIGVHEEHHHYHRSDSTGRTRSLAPGPLAGMVVQLVANAVWRKQNKNEDNVADDLWKIIKNRLAVKGLAQLEAEPNRSAWTARLREHVELFLAEDEEFAKTANRMVFGNGGPGDAFWQLPADNPGFANREREIRKIKQVFASSAATSPRGRTVRQLLGRSAGRDNPVVEITGPPMIGKTELAVHAGHLLESHFSDGCFVVDVGGPLGWSKEITDELVDLLRAQGTPLGEIPETYEQALRRYRSWFRRKRALVIIENASDVEQVRAFLPPDRGCGAIVTSRTGVLGLGKEKVCSLNTFSRGAALTMLRNLDRSSRSWSDDMSDVVASPTRRVLGWCGWHPAVIAVVAAWIRQPSMADHSSSDIAEKLWERETEFSAEVLQRSSSLRAGLDRLYKQTEGISPDVAQLFRLLGLLSVPYVDVSMAAALTGMSGHVAEAGLRRLVDLGVLTMDCGWYEMAPYYQRMAESKARELDSADKRKIALTRAFRHFLEREDAWGTAEAAMTLDQISEASRERANSITAVARAFAEGLYDLAWRLALHCAKFFDAHGYWSAWVTTGHIARRSAGMLEREEARLEALARTELNLAAAFLARGWDATEPYEAGLNRVRELARFGAVCAERTDLEAARRCITTSTELARACHDARWTDIASSQTDALLAAVEDVVEQWRGKIGS